MPNKQIIKFFLLIYKACNRHQITSGINCVITFDSEEPNLERLIFRKSEALLEKLNKNKPLFF